MSELKNIDYSSMDLPETFVPYHMRDGYKLYFEHGIPPGSFGQAVIRGDLEDARCRADHINSRHIETQIAWVQKQISQTQKGTNQ